MSVMMEVVNILMQIFHFVAIMVGYVYIVWVGPDKLSTDSTYALLVIVFFVIVTNQYEESK